MVSEGAKAGGYSERRRRVELMVTDQLSCAGWESGRRRWPRQPAIARESPTHRGERHGNEPCGRSWLSWQAEHNVPHDAACLEVKNRHDESVSTGAGGCCHIGKNRRRRVRGERWTKSSSDSGDGPRLRPSEAATGVCARLDATVTIWFRRQGKKRGGGVFAHYCTGHGRNLHGLECATNGGLRSRKVHPP